MSKRSHILSASESGMRSTRIGSTALKLGVSLVLIAAVLSFINFGEVLALLLEMNPWYVLAAIAVLYADRALMAYKWGLLLKAADVKIPFFPLFQTYAISALPGLLLPASLGGDLFRLYNVARHANSKAEAVLASLVAERVIAVVALLIVVLFSMGMAAYLIDDASRYIGGVAWILSIGIGLATMVIMLFYGLIKKKINDWVRRLKEHAIGRKLAQAYVLCCEYKKHFRTVTAVFALTLLEQLAPILGFLLRGYALHINVSILELVAIVPIVVLLIRLPVTLNGFGVEEGMYVALFALVGVSASEAFLLSISGRLLLLLTAVPWTIHFMLTSDLRKFRNVGHVGLAK